MSCIIRDLGELRKPGNFVYESEDVFAIMTLEQPNPYKVIVCPRAHVETVYDLTDVLLCMFNDFPGVAVTEAR